MRDIDEILQVGRDLLYSNQRIGDNINTVSTQLMQVNSTLMTGGGSLTIEWDDPGVKEHIRLQRMEAWLQGAYPEIHQQWKALEGLENSIRKDEAGS